MGQSRVPRGGVQSDEPALFPVGDARRRLAVPAAHQQGHVETPDILFQPEHQRDAADLPTRNLAQLHRLDCQDLALLQPEHNFSQDHLRPGRLPRLLVDRVHPQLPLQLALGLHQLHHQVPQHEEAQQVHR